MSYYNKKKWKYIAVKGLGFIPFYGCPHFHAEKGRVNSFRNMVLTRNVLGFGIDNDSAFVVDGTKLYSISSNKNSGVFLIDACCGNSTPKKIKSKEVFGSLI
jgi:cyanophycinase-like exopeptidase